jgi:hemerythrin
LLNDRNEVEFLNERFIQSFDADVLTSNEMRQIVRTPGETWHSVRLTHKGGREANAYAQAMRIQNSIMLVVSDIPELEWQDQLEALRDRVAELERLSSTDPLTGAWNRAHLERVIESELSRSLRFRQPVTLILLDIDHFKRINDTYGHQAGDVVLRELVGVVKASIRTADILFRWGGEEFVVLASSTGYRGAAVLAETIRDAIAQHAFSTVGTTTVSVGVAEHMMADSAEMWFRRVDEALYVAKDGGRNRVSVDRRGSSDMWAVEKGSGILTLAWSEAYECGEAIIDREHQELFDLGNELIGASMATGGDSDAIKLGLDKMFSAVVQHFVDEEALLAQRGYSRLEEHRQAHERLLQRARELMQSADTGGITTGVIVEYLARDVVAKHILKVDRDYYPLFIRP